MDEVQHPLTGEALLQKLKETKHLSRREVARLCGYYEITATNQTRVRLTDFYDAVLAAQKVEGRSQPTPHSLNTTLVRERSTSMTQLIKELSISCGDIQTIGVSTPPLDFQNYTDDDINAYWDQGFFWHPNCVGFKIRNEIGGCWVKIYVSERLELKAETQRAIVVPYRVSQENYFYLSGDNPMGHVDLSSGQYQLLYQNRYLSDAEIESLGQFDYFNPDIDSDDTRPELCLLTFIPTPEEIEPKILRCEPGFNPPSELILFREPMPQH